MPPTRTRPPQLLIASHNHGAGAELLQLAERRGYAVRRAHSGARALEQAHAAPPDLVVLDESLTDMDAFTATRALRDDDHVGPGTPLLLISAQRPSSPQHHTALRAERLARGVKTLAGATPGLCAGYDAVGNARYTPIEPKNLLSRATTALRAAKGQGGPNWIQGFNS